MESRPQSEVFLDILRQELEEEQKNQPDQAVADLLNSPLALKVAQALNASATAEATAVQSAVAEDAVDPRPVLTPSHATILAALEDTFVIGDLEVTDSERRELIAASRVVFLNGQRRLRLSDPARAELLTAATALPLYKQLLSEAVKRDLSQVTEIGRDPNRLPSVWLRRFLFGRFPDLDSAPLRELQAACSARQRLQFVRDLSTNVPPVDEMSRRVGLAELLEPLRLLIGSEGGWDGTPPRDRFIGRKADLTKLRRFVDELESQSGLEAVTRFIDRTFRTKTPGLLMIYGRGGLGKSTLIAKFLIDHACNEQHPVPFAYLDFDRAALDPLRPRQLLAEIVRQVALQPFPDAKPHLDKLATDIRASLVSLPPAQIANSLPNQNRSQRLGVQTSFRPDTTEIQDPMARFVEILHDHVTHKQRAFLLVLDTLEIVQWNQEAVATLVKLISDFRAKGLDELRVVASGRADIPQLHPSVATDGDTRDIEMTPLVVEEARALATRLGRTTIGHEWRDAWSAAIAGTAKDHSVRREPLSVRVAVDLVARTDSSQRPALLTDIGKSGTGGADDFVARLYEKRIVLHVRDPLARKLAWPGLVVRRINNEIARELLAPYCGITPDEAVQAVESLGREVWMVTKSGDGTLRHRPELRARTLPLMRRKNPDAFDAIAHAAVEYFAGHRDRSPDDHQEWIYHRLLAGETPADVAREITPEILVRLKDDIPDFPAPAASYIAARTESSRLPPGKLRQLTPADALYHLVRTSDEAFGFDDRTLDLGVLNVAASIDAEVLADEPEVRTAAGSLWIKTGMWTRMPESFDPYEVRVGPDIRAHVYWAAHVGMAASAHQRSQLLDACLRLTTPRSSAMAGRAGFRASVQAMAFARLAGSDNFARLDASVADILKGVRPDPLPTIQSALRTSIIFGRASQGPALALWLTSRRRGSEDRIRMATMSRAELEMLARMDTDARDRLQAVLKERWTPPRVADEEILRPAYHALEELLSDVISGAPIAADVSRMFALRNEDWIVPFGYAASRATRARLTPVVMDRLSLYLDQRTPAFREVAADMVGAIRTADEASDLAAFVELLAADSADREAARDLRFLIDCRNRWSEAVGALFGQSKAGVHAAEVAEQPSASAGDASAQPPPPGPIRHKDDPQKDRWGGKPEVDGRRVSAVLDSVEREIFYFSVVIESTDGTKLEPPIVIHVHDSYQRSVVRLRNVTDGKYATLSDWNAYGVFAIGVQVRNGRGEWISLEFDLASLPSLPKRFLDR